MKAGFERMASAISSSASIARDPDVSHRIGLAPKLTTNPRRRPAEENRKAVRKHSLPPMPLTISQAKVRQYLERLVGKGRLLVPLVHADEAVAFAARWNVDEGESCGPCCNAESFKFDILGPPHSPWNKSASRVFCDSYIKFYNLPSTHAVIMDVENSFFLRLKTLKQKFKSSRLLADQQETVRARARRYQRKSQVCSQLMIHLSSLISR
jgi:hypothetical protein